MITTADLRPIGTVSLLFILQKITKKIRKHDVLLLALIWSTKFC